MKQNITDLKSFEISNESIKRLITPKEYAKKEGVTPKCIYDRIKKGTLQNCIIAGVIFVITPVGC